MLCNILIQGKYDVYILGSNKKINYISHHQLMLGNDGCHGYAVYKSGSSIPFIRHKHGLTPRYLNLLMQNEKAILTQ